ncbi:MipA/OmpV family protein [Corallincola spongiicola]|uniref:MipA/OmpV family protein n=1 Tax=Corallincola spongiicola TaxID=2520508 RepID=A0ABY1WLA6_9GAMM|nr:MipA/OmpV family protein [Corallincola spongiicola]TAA41018.1 MipA/OmpV family protein [Corallincola spongiicola]
MNMKHLLVLALASSLPATAMAAGDTEIGVGVQVPSSAYRNYDDSARAIPIIKFDTEWFYADGGEVGFKALDKGPHRIGIYLTMGEEEWDGSDNDQAEFDGFEDKDRAFHLGASYRFKAKWGVVRAQYFTDISDEHDGNGAALSYAYPWKVSDKIVLIPSVRIKYMDEDYANYYYGISNRDAATSAAVSAYDTGSATNISVGLMAGYHLAEHWNLYAGVTYTSLDDDLEESPLLDDDNETSGMLGVAYKF